MNWLWSIDAAAAQSYDTWGLLVRTRKSRVLPCSGIIPSRGIMFLLVVEEVFDQSQAVFPPDSQLVLARIFFSFVLSQSLNFVQLTKVIKRGKTKLRYLFLSASPRL